MSHPKQHWRFLKTGAADGVFNMTADETLATLRDQAAPILRVYSWRPFTISLGYHQPMAEVNVARCYQDGLGLVRRPTGGRAILHAREVTYSVIIPQSHPLYQESSLSIYKSISRALVAGLRAIGMPAVLEKSNGRDTEFARYHRRFSCFATSAKYEIHYQSRKLVGSAQRRFENGLLQHGSILLGDEHLDLTKYMSENGRAQDGDSRARLQSRTSTLESILQRTVTFDEMATCLQHGFETTFDVTLSPDEFSTAELQQIEQVKPQYINLT